VPQLSFIVVEGALIFAPDADPTHHRTFDAGYIFINNGYMEVGTEEFPYTSRITITMHGDVTTPAIPTYGNKNIAVRRGQLHLVGKPVPVTWTMLDSTVAAGSNQITLQAQPSVFNWAVGDQIVIASTDYMKAYAEQIRPFIPKGRTYKVLGTDGFGRSDFRSKLREHFEVNRHFIVVAALKALSEEGTVPVEKVAEAIKKYGIKADKVNPLYA